MLRYERRERRASERHDRLHSGASGGVLGPGEVGRALRNERVRQGLSYRDVSRRIGVAEERLRAAETGVLGRTDQLSTLQTVRRYADALGLPGDRYALAIVQHWPSGRVGGGAPRPAGRDEPTAATPAVASAGSPQGPARPDDLFGTPFTPFATDFVVFDAPYRGTGQVAAGQVAGPDAATSGYDTGMVTGIVPAVPIATTGRVVRRNPMPWPLRAAAVVLGLAVVAGGAVLAIDRLHPSWLQGVGLARASAGEPAATHGAHRGGAAGGTAGGASAAASRGSATATSGHTTSTATGSHGKAVVADALHPTVTSRNSASLAAGPGTAHLTVSAMGAPCWVEVLSPTSPTPLYSGVMPEGATRTFTVAHAASVELGSAAGRISVKSHSGHLTAYKPPVAPFTLSISTSG